DGIRDGHVTGVQTCALPISSAWSRASAGSASRASSGTARENVAPDPIARPPLFARHAATVASSGFVHVAQPHVIGRPAGSNHSEIGRASCRERVVYTVV